MSTCAHTHNHTDVFLQGCPISSPSLVEGINGQALGEQGGADDRVASGRRPVQAAAPTAILRVFSVKLSLLHPINRSDSLYSHNPGGSVGTALA